MSPDNGRRFSTSVSAHRKRRMSTLRKARGSFAPSLTTLYVGISAVFSDDHTAVVALAIHDHVYEVDYSVKYIALNGHLETTQKEKQQQGHGKQEKQEKQEKQQGASVAEGNAVADYIVGELARYEHANDAKFIGAGLPATLHYMSPTLCSRLWLELDIIPIVLRPEEDHQRRDSRDSVGLIGPGYSDGGGRGNDNDGASRSFWHAKRVDEQAESMARKCILCFGPSLVPVLQVGWRGAVQTDAGLRAQLTTVANHQATCGAATWEAMLVFARQLRQKKVKIAFFSSTPQGGGVALMRHALVRFSRLMGIDLTWYVPKPRPGVFRITKNVHNILQGVSHPDQRISAEEKATITDWITENARRYWLSDGGPLRPAGEGGADVIIIDDPQMPGLIPLIKHLTPDRPVLYRSHIQIRSDLVANKGSPQADIWDFLWGNIQHADMFISHPIPQFVPHNVPREKVAYMPATTDWLDGLNKHLNTWDTGYYGHIYNTACHAQNMTELQWPTRRYIAQIARFDPAKGIRTVIDAYADFRRQLDAAASDGGRDDHQDVPQLVVCGNGSIDDPDASLIYDQTMNQVETHYSHLAGDISVMRLDPNDQVLNTILANAHVVLQLSTREGFEVKVSEALHAGRPVIATRAGGIPIQVKDKVNGFLVQPDDWKAVARHLVDLFRDDDLHRSMSHAARTGVSDEVGTVGNALSWFYLAAKWHDARSSRSGSRSSLSGNEKWVNDMAREEAGFPYAKGENRLDRHFTEHKTAAIHLPKPEAA